MTKLFLIAASAMLTLAAGPVAARDTATTLPTEQPAVPRVERSAQRYCIVQTITGSWIPRKVCQTRSEWMNEGFDPLHPDK